MALEAVIGAVSRALLGARADVTVKARSNRDVLTGKLSMLSVDAGSMAGLLLSARGGSLRGVQLDLGLRPLLVLLYFPVVLFGLVDFLSWTALTLLAYNLLPAASPSSSLQYTLSLTEQDMNSSFAIRWVLKIALSALMQNSLLVSALSSASMSKEGAWMQRLVSATDYRLSSTSLQVSRTGGGLFGAGSVSGRLIMDATAVLPRGESSPQVQGSTPQDGGSFNFKLRTSLQAQPAGSILNTVNGPMVAQSNQCIFVDPEILVTPGWPLPEFWLPVGSGVSIDLGLGNCINTLDFVAGEGGSGASGGLQVAGEWRLGPPSP